MDSRLVAVSGTLLLLAIGTSSFAQTTQRTPIPSTPPSASAKQYKSEADAKSGCGTDQVVWANTSSHVLHKAGTRYYGKTTHGAYMCEGDATKAGYHIAKNE
jgi:hypothetical protein